MTGVTHGRRVCAVLTSKGRHNPTVLIRSGGTIYLKEGGAHSLHAHDPLPYHSTCGYSVLVTIWVLCFGQHMGMLFGQHLGMVFWSTYGYGGLVQLSLCWCWVNHSSVMAGGLGGNGQPQNFLSTGLGVSTLLAYRSCTTRCVAGTPDMEYG